MPGPLNTLRRNVKSVKPNLMENLKTSQNNDFSAEDDSEAQSVFENAAAGEFKRLIERLKEEEKKKDEAGTK